MSEVRLEYGQSVVALPKDRLLEAMSGADMEKMRVLLLLAPNCTLEQRTSLRLRGRSVPYFSVHE